jgi:hypothetical protein
MYGLFTSWATNYVAMALKHGNWRSVLLHLAATAIVTYLGRKLGFKYRIMPLEVMMGHLFYRMGRQDKHLLVTGYEEIAQIIKRIKTGDPKEMQKAIEEITYLFPGGEWNRRAVTVIKAGLNDWVVDKGSHSYEFTGPVHITRYLMGYDLATANQWDMVMWMPEWADEVEKETTGRPLRKTHKAYETALHLALNPKAEVKAYSIWLALTGKGYEVDDLLKSPGAAVEAIEKRMFAAGMDVDAAHKQAIGNIKTYYAERAKISVMKGKDNWRTQFDEHMAFIYKIQPDEPGKTRAEVEIKARNSRRGSYYNILGDAIKGDDKNLEGRAVWALERLGASREQINKVMAGRDVRLPTYDYK